MASDTMDNFSWKNADRKALLKLKEHLRAAEKHGHQEQIESLKFRIKKQEKHNG